MIKRISYDPLIHTGAVALDVAKSEDLSRFTLDDGVFSLRMDADTAVYGLGESMRGINKRGWIYESWCADDPSHTEDKRSLYGAHNFILIDGEERFGAFFDTPGRITFDVGYTESDLLTVTPGSFHLELYIIEGDTLKDIVHQFRTLIGQSYIPPFWAFGFGQSRWSYWRQDAVEEVADGYRDAHIPLDMIYLDIDYLDDFKDFTVSEERFPDFAAFVGAMKARGIRLIPIIDAAVKAEPGYSVYDEGHANGYFCKDEQGEDFIVGVWPGMSALPDFLNDDAARWFGDKYRILTEMGIEGFWNDMNEPALFYSKKGLDEAIAQLKEVGDTELDARSFFRTRDLFNKLQNAPSDYDSFYHDTSAGRLRHSEVHNLYGYYMTRSAAEGLERACEGQRCLLFSRASYIGMHRYSGVWTGDNHSWWSHILQLLHQLPGLNMCGFLYSGCDIGGFNGNCTRDLLLRWLALAVFTPLMRDHSALGTREQEAYAFGDPAPLRQVIELRYRLLPYLYSEFMKAATGGEMLFRPLAFDYPDDRRARGVEDQLLFGEGLLIAPVYTQNAEGRMVYLPEGMTLTRMHEGEILTEELTAGDHYISVPLGDVVFFIRPGRLLPLSSPAMNTAGVRYDHFDCYGTGSDYALYTDDGVSTDLSSAETIIIKNNV